MTISQQARFRASRVHAAVCADAAFDKRMTGMEECLREDEEVSLEHADRFLHVTRSRQEETFNFPPRGC